MLDFVPDLPRTHALEIDVLSLLIDADRENLRRHLLERHKRPLGRVAGAGANGFVLVATRLEIVLRELNCLADQFVPERETTLGLTHAEIDSRSAESTRINPLIEEIF